MGSNIVIASESERETPAASSAMAIPQDTDQQLVDLWLNGLSKHTQRAYRRDSRLFFNHVATPLRQVTLAQVQSFAAHLQTLDLVPGSRHRALSAVKSLTAFATRLGYLPMDVAAPLRLPACKDKLSERILEEDEVRRLIIGETNPRNHLILQLLYNAGLRVSELAELTWGDLQPHRRGGQLTVFGKGGKTRTVRLEEAMWLPINNTRAGAAADAPVFISRRGKNNCLSTSQVLRIVRAAAKRAGIDKPVSPHWLRHCHASHTLDAGAPIHLVQQTLGHSSVATTSRYLHARPSESSSRFLKPIV